MVIFVAHNKTTHKMGLTSWLIENAKAVIMGIAMGIISAFTPIQDALCLLGGAFAFNIWVGIAEDKKVNKGKFSIKKAFEAIQQLGLYVALVFLMEQVGTKQHDQEIARLGVKWITYIVVYFYTTNVLKNAHSMFPKSATIKFLYDLFSTEIFNILQEKIGFTLKKERDKNKESETPNQDDE